MVGGVLTIGLVLGIDKTNFGAKVRAAVDNRRMTTSCGINIDRLFALAFAIGSALAGLGGGLAVYLVGLDPTFPLKYLVFLLIVVVVGGLGSIKGTLAASIALGICDVTGKYYVPQAGAFILYAVTVVIAAVAPARPVRTALRWQQSPSTARPACCSARAAAGAGRRSAFWVLAGGGDFRSFPAISCSSPRR